MNITPIVTIAVPLIMMVVYATVGFGVVYFAVRLAIRHESRSKRIDPSVSLRSE